MTLAMLDDRPRPQTAAPVAGLRLVVLARLAVGEGTTRSELNRELAPIVGGPAGRLAIDVELAALVRADYAMENRSRFKPTPVGQQLVLDAIALKAVPRSWTELRDIRLVALALGIAQDPPSRLKHLSKPEGLRAAILAAAYDFKLRGPASPSKLRAELALVALERAFGNKIKSGLPTRGAFNAKTSRMLAGQLLARPRDAGTDSRLISALSAEVVGSSKTDAEALRAALLRRFASPPVVTNAQVPDVANAPSVATTGTNRATTPNQRTNAEQRPSRTVPAGAPVPPRPPAASRPDLTGFAAAVQRAARTCADGWPGNRKALVSRVWQAISVAHPAWGLSAIEFKAMLAEAHRTGHLVLATADLRDKSLLKELQDSAITYKNTVWHQLRVED
jgi:hypothetical protein